MAYNPHDPDWGEYYDRLDELAEELTHLRHLLYDMEKEGYDNNAINSDTAEEMRDMVREQMSDIYQYHKDYFDPYIQAGVSESDF